MLKRKSSFFMTIILSSILLLTVGLISRFQTAADDYLSDVEQSTEEALGAQFYVKTADNVAIPQQSQMNFFPGEQNTFVVETVLAKDPDTIFDFTYKITPNYSCNSLAYSLDGNIYNYPGKDSAFVSPLDFTSSFDIERKGNKLTLTVPEDLTLEKVLEKSYGKDVEMISHPALADESYFYTFTIIPAVGDTVYYINFSFLQPVESIAFNDTYIIFN